MNLLDKFKSDDSRPPFCEVSQMNQVNIARFDWLIYQYKFANRLQVRYEFNNMKKLVKKLAKIETSSICCHLFANVFADFFVLFTHTNLDLQTRVCQL